MGCHMLWLNISLMDSYNSEGTNKSREKCFPEFSVSFHTAQTEMGVSRTVTQGVFLIHIR